MSLCTFLLISLNSSTRPRTPQSSRLATLAPTRRYWLSPIPAPAPGAQPVRDARSRRDARRAWFLHPSRGWQAPPHQLHHNPQEPLHFRCRDGSRVRPRPSAHRLPHRRNQRRSVAPQPDDEPRIPQDRHRHTHNLWWISVRVGGQGQGSRPACRYMGAHPDLRISTERFLWADACISDNSDTLS